MTRYAISQPVTQVEAPRLLTGNGRFTDDIALPRQAVAVFLRSPHAHADIVRIDISAAASMPGVVAILTGADYAADGLGVVRGISPLKRRDGSPMFRPPRPALTRDRVRHVGQSVALIVAETVNQAKDAAENIEVEYAPLPAHLSTADANQPATPALWEDCKDNEAVFAESGDAAAVEAALARAAHVVGDRFVVNRVAANTMEPRAVVADYDQGRDHYTIHACHQRPYIWRTMMTKHVFDIAENQMTIIAGDVGGSFGMKGGLYPEVPLIAWASRRVGRPVKWNCERSEGLMSDDQARDMVVDAELGLDSDGKFLAMKLSSNNNVGAYVTMIGFISTRGITTTPCGVYATPAAYGRASAVLTNTVPVSNYRAPGGTPGTYVLERIIDMAARDTGLDPVEIRRRNLIPADAMPYRLPTGGGYDCGEFEAVMDKCLALADYAAAGVRKEAAKANGRLRGVGVSSSVDPSAGPSPETTFLVFNQNYETVQEPKVSWFNDGGFRKAMAHLIDRETIIRDVQSGFGDPQYSFIPSASPYYRPDASLMYPDYNPKAAGDILDDMDLTDRNGDGVREDENGNRVTFLLQTNSDNDNRVGIAEMFVREAKAVGVDVIFKTENFNTLTKSLLETYRWDAMITGLSSSVDPVSGASVYPSSGRLHLTEPLQESPRRDWEKRADRWWSNTTLTLDENRWVKGYMELQGIWAEELPWIFLTVNVELYAASNRLGNIKPVPAMDGLFGICERLYFK